MRIIPATLCCIMLAISGCAHNPVYKPVPEAAVSQMNTVEPILFAPQKELGLTIVVQDSGNAGSQFGLFGVVVSGLLDAGVNANRLSNAENAAAPVRNALKSFDVNELLRSKIDTALFKVSWIGGVPVDLITEDKTTLIEKRYADSSHDAVMVISYSYRLSADFRVLYTSANVILVPKTAALRALQKNLYPASELDNRDADVLRNVNALYSHTLSMQFPMASGGDIQSIGRAISINNGATVRAALTESVSVFAAVLAQDLSKAEQLVPGKSEDFIRKSYIVPVEGKRYQVVPTQDWGSIISRIP